ncbi:hypothetical protein MKW92_049516 [Papaver armeniacum]|nr:hypothetical protein MKW92_049516 [Papaver armeniacum]
MEASATTPTTVTSLSVNDEVAAATTTSTTITSLNDGITSAEHVQAVLPLEIPSQLVDGGEGEVGVVTALNENDEDVHATMASTLPRIVIIQTNYTNNRYLRFESQFQNIPNALRFGGDYSFGLETRFELVPATSGSGLVHIRSLHNNKYWALSGSEYNWITAMSVKPDEDQSNRRCTLFQPVFVYSNNNRVVRLRHVHTGRFLYFYTPDFGGFRGCLTLVGNLDANVFTLFDWESIVVLPDRGFLSVHNTNTVFLPIRFSGGRVLLRCLRSNNLCQPFTGIPGLLLFLAARANFPGAASYMEIEEPVDSRTISNVRYRVADARIYNERVTELITDTTVNRLDVPITSELNLTQTVTNTTNWSRSVTLTIGVTTGGSAGIPFVTDGKIEISTEVSNSWDWGETKEESLQVGSVRTVDVPPMSRVRGNLMATRLSYDIPFSYTQRDDDGLFTGHNGYGYYFEFVPLPLD